jgi:hypothetical protein
MLMYNSYKRKHAMSHNRRAKNRARQRAARASWDTETKFTPYQRPSLLGARTRSITQAEGHPVIHRTHFKNQRLRFVEFGLAISLEGSRGYGLRATIDFKAGCPITQYEGVIVLKMNAEALREGPQGKTLGSHLATTSARSMVINGYSLAADCNDNSAPIQGGVPLPRQDWRGRGGGSMCNYDNDPNATLQRDCSGDGYGIFVIARRDIRAGEFIHVDYGKSFIRSNKSNI